MKNRQIVATATKAFANMEVKATSTGKPFFRAVLPAFNEVTGTIDTQLTDKQNVALEKGEYEIGDVLNGTYRAGLRYYSENADGSDRTVKFFRWELLEAVNTDEEAKASSIATKAAIQQKMLTKVAKADYQLTEADVNLISQF